MKVYLSTLGCKLNESELKSWARRFADDGCEVVGDPRDADICVLNTCTVTHTAARKSRQMARQLARANPATRIVLTGCFGDIAPDEAKALPNVALVVPNADKDRLVEQVAASSSKQQAGSPEGTEGSPASNLQLLASNFPFQTSNLQPPISNLHSPNSRTRAFVKIQDGCNMSCTYCIIPLARGRERSRSREEIVAEVQSLVSAGYKEIILTGVQISAYSNLAKVEDPAFLSGVANLRKDSLRDLVAAILAETAVPRLRLTSIAPWDLDESLLDLWRDPRLCRHLHLSLQSGSDTVLRRMRRPYTTAQFARAAEQARGKIPGVGITTDVIVGFPGESAVEFEQSLRFVEQMQFSRAHVFPYSARAGTVAATLPLPVADAVKSARRAQMQATADASARAFAAQFVGQTMPVLWETVNSGKWIVDSDSPLTTHYSPLVWSGYTDNYIRVLAASDTNLYNQISPACVRNIEEDGVIADLV
ncbi:MAG: tRNA (N(6)-L-threonylcarbamoyladenosine(37)-C(2))-methylthiotransferase MtaB [Chloroflexota bacterium]|nr:tRNA (N(6)-L-threonylcarbamoyladenosine(37)-C(2))-methylthiotransferase MtaB [Chloroflexota bacterium]